MWASRRAGPLLEGKGSCFFRNPCSIKLQQFLSGCLDGDTLVAEARYASVSSWLHRSRRRTI